VADVTPNYKICGDPGHVAAECQLLASFDQVNYAQGNPYFNTNNPGFRNHPNFSYKNNNHTFVLNPPPGFQGPKGALVASTTPKELNLELMVENFTMAQSQQNKDFLNQNIHTNKLIKQLTNKVDVMATHNKMLETHISKVAQQQA